MTHDTARPFPWLGLFILAGTTFSSVTSEFLPTGLLPDMARDLDVSESQVGLLMTLFAATVVVSAPLLATVTRRYSRKSLIIAVLLVFIAANVLAAIAPTYGVLAVARVIGGAAHGLFWAVVGAYSAHLVPKHQLGRAIAITSGGTTVAFVLGVPIGTAIGHALGWRLAFGVIAVVIFVLMILIIRFLPAVEHREVLATGEIPLPLRKDPTVIGVVLVCALVIIAMTGQNTYYTYIASWLPAVAGFDPSAVAPMLFVYGGAGAIGLVIAGVISDRYPRAGISGTILVMLLSVVTLGIGSGNQLVVIAAFATWGIAMGAAPPILQSRLLHTASPRIRDISSAFFTSSFNLAIGGGALVGGVLLDSVGIRVLPFIGAIGIAAGLVVLLSSDAWLRRTHRHGTR